MCSTYRDEPKTHIKKTRLNLSFVPFFPICLERRVEHEHYGSHTTAERHRSLSKRFVPTWTIMSNTKIKRWSQLNENELDERAKEEPGKALRYADNRLSSERLHACAMERPRDALVYAKRLLSEECLAACVKAEPLVAMTYAAIVLREEDLEFCAKTNPAYALQVIPTYLSTKVINTIAKEDPAAFRIFWENLPYFQRAIYTERGILQPE